MLLKKAKEYMERHFLFIDWKTWYYSDINAAQNDLQIQYNLHQNPNNAFVKVEKVMLKLIWVSTVSFIVNTVLGKNKVEGLIFPTTKVL